MLLLLYVLRTRVFWRREAGLCKSAASAAHAPVVVCVAHACLLAQGG